MIYRFLLLALVILMTNSCAATAKKKSPKINIQLQKPIIPSATTLENIAKNGVVQDFGERNLSSLIEKFRSANDMRIHIFGDSHIAGDFIPQRWRAQFMQPNAIGFAYPIFPAYHQNLLINYKSQFFELYNSRINIYPDYPMGGVVARAKSEKAFVKIALNFVRENQQFTTRIVFKSPSLLGAFVVTDAKGQSYRLGASVPNTWEISKPLTLTFPITIKALLPNAALGGYFIYNQGANTIISHSGANGARSDIWLKWNQPLFRQSLQIITYDLFVLCYGSNDAMLATFDKNTFIKNYKNLIATLRQTNPNASILLIAPPKTLIKRAKSSTYTFAPSFKAVQSAILEIAKSEKVLYFDMFNLMEKTGGKDEWIKLGLSKQDVHLSPYGYRAVADAIEFGLRGLFETSQAQSQMQSQTKTESLDSPQTTESKNPAESKNATESTESEKSMESMESMESAQSIDSTPNPTNTTTTSANDSKTADSTTAPNSSIDSANATTSANSLTESSPSTSANPQTNQATSNSATNNSTNNPPTNNPSANPPANNSTTPNNNITNDAADEIWQDLQIKDFSAP